MDHKEFAELAARHLETVADRLEEESCKRGIDGKISERSRELRVAAQIVLNDSAEVARDEDIDQTRRLRRTSPIAATS